MFTLVCPTFEPKEVHTLTAPISRERRISLSRCCIVMVLNETHTLLTCYSYALASYRCHEMKRFASYNGFDTRTVFFYNQYLLHVVHKVYVNVHKHNVLRSVFYVVPAT